jgi:hypothetical protein
MLVDDKLVVLISGKLVEVKPLIDEKKDILDSCADPVDGM